MIVSHRNRFIFIKTKKTASTSVELFLRQFCGPDDIITRDTPDDERLARSLGLPSHQHHGATIVMPWAIRGGDLWWARRNRDYPRRPGIGVHVDARTIRDLVGDEVWQSYAKITTVRDPWDATVSLYYWRMTTGGRGKPDRPGHTLDDAVERSGRNWATYTIDDVPVVDHVIRHERLEADLNAVCEALGLSPRLALPVAKGSIRPPKSPASEMLSIAQAQRVAELAAGEIGWLGYEWSGPDLG